MGLPAFVSMQLFSKAMQNVFRSTGRKTEFNVKQAFKVTQSDVFWDQWKANEGLHVAI